MVKIMNEELIRQCAMDGENKMEAIHLYHARAVAPLELERDEADRQAGALRRENERLKDDVIRRAEWLRKAKQEAGYRDAVSFDVVWKDTLAKAQAVAPLVEALRGIADHPGPYADESAWSRVESAKEALAAFGKGEE